MNSYLLDTLIRDRLSDARDRSAKHALLRSVKRTPRTRRHAWVEVLKGFALRGAQSIWRRRHTTPGTEATATHGAVAASHVGWRHRLRVDGLFMTVIGVAFLATGCGPSTTAEFPSTSGRRVQGASMVAEGAFPVRLGAYELLFATTPNTPWQVRRAALLVDLAGGQGLARGFVEADRAGETPIIHTAEGWARQREIDGERLTVFELHLNYLAGRATPRVARESGHLVPFVIRVVVHEGSGDVTLTRQR